MFSDAAADLIVHFLTVSWRLFRRDILVHVLIIIRKIKFQSNKAVSICGEMTLAHQVLSVMIYIQLT